MNFTILSYLVRPSCISRPILYLLHYIHQHKYYLIKILLNQNCRRSNTSGLRTNQHVVFINLLKTIKTIKTLTWQEKVARMSGGKTEQN